jgi:hypothetical protein
MSRNSSLPVDSSGEDKRGASNDSVSPSKRSKFSDLQVIEKPNPRLFITEPVGAWAVVTSAELLGCDAFMQPIIDYMSKPGQSLKVQEGFVLAAQRRMDQINFFAKVNANSTFSRRVLVRVNPPDRVATTETRRVLLDRLVQVRKH